VAHPNVLPVFEAGVVDERAYIVTEHVDGMTLRAWLSARRRTAPEIVAMFRAAGRGLAALHAVGLVHCDFKPDNVLISEPERVLVCDLGLAANQPDETGDSSSPLDVTLRIGFAFGTVRYMSPEQHRGDRPDPRADQYAFCVALYEALYREPPFFGVSIEELVERKRAGLPAVQGEPEHPRLRAVLARGLAPDASERFPDMHALLAALAGANRRARRWLWLPPLAVLAAIGWLPAREASPHLDGTAFTGLADAVPRVHAEDLLQLALDVEREGELAESIEINERAYEVALADGDDRALALAAATMLRRVADFRRDPQKNQFWRSRAEKALGMAPDEMRAWHEYDEGVYQMEVRAGHIDAAQAAREQLLARGRLDPIDGARAELIALEFEGDLAAIRGNLAAADAAGEPLLEAARQSFGNDAPETARALLTAAAWSIYNGKSERVLPWIDEAAAIYARTCGPDHPRNLHLRMVRGWALGGIRDNAAAFASMAEAAELRERWAPDALGLEAEIADTMGALARRMHDYDRARTLHYSALVAYESELGPDATRMYAVLLNLAVLEESLGNCPKAREHAERADALLAHRGLPSDDPMRVTLAGIKRCKA
jgi:hypothetical protein